MSLSYKKKDFVSDQDVRWCPGCGDYAILSATQQVFAKLDIPKENFVVVSGIGCSSRFPYYVDTFGFHSIHGRAPAIASGVKIANPDLDVWVVTGDGDALSIGGNHIIHAARRNINMTVLLFNNRIYGLTKGQYSPTSDPGTKTGSTPYGSLDTPFNPITLMLGAGAGFVARTVDTQIPHMKSVIEAAHAYQGFSFVEILQNCVIFADKVFEHITEKGIRDSRQVNLMHGEPLVYGNDLEKGLQFTADGLKIVAADQADTWDAQQRDAAKAYQICQSQENGEFPVPIGIFHSVERATLDAQVHAQIAETTEKLGKGSITSLLQSGEIWNVGEK
jgi:2-oxoglutarate ferredoxin oxidoreductase subunit beta